MELNDDESDDDPDTAAKSVEFSENVQEFGTRNSSVASSQWSMTSNMNSCNASSAKDSSAVISSPNCQQPSIPSLFMSMTCSVRSHGNLTVRTVPTCLNEISSCFDDSLVDVDLDEVKVTLDILCLTLSSDVESGYLQQSSRIRRTTSFCSSSSPAQDLPENPDGVVEDSLNGSIFPNSADPISHLSTVQQHAVKSIISQVNWMLMDEVASSALDTYPITTEILEKVSKHIDGTKHVPTCITEEVPLKFVCGTKTSLDKFIDKFKRLSVPSYHLNQEGDYYYLVKDNKSEDSGKRRRSSSLVPPLFVSDPPPLNLHSDDGTELRSITAANDAPPIAEGFVKIRKPSVDVLGDSPPIKKEDIFSNVTERNLLRRRTTDDSDDDSDDEASKDIGKQTLKGKKLRASRERETSAFVSGISKPITELEGHPIGTSSPKKSSDRSSSTRSQIRTVTTFTDARNSASQLKILKLAPDVNDDSICASFSPPHNIKTTMSTLWQSKQVATGSRYCSNTEDGYDGDGSDSEIENQWLSIFDRHRPVLPNFWLIMKVSNNSVHTYFHTRKTSDIADKLSDYIHVQQQVVTIIKNICKLVNQTLLLQSLHERRMCQKLLVPETNDDIWKQGASSATLGHHLQDSQEYEADAEYTGGNYLEATMKFKPGAFACDVVWETYFVLHHRLITGHAHGGMSRGIQALRTLLNSISVNNRTNMFVYREPSGSVFYLRLHELTQYVPTSSGSIMANPWDQPYSNASKTDDDNSIIGSRSSSILSLNT
ncbi:SZT2 (predicted), partial [Pycnogonum litorale]